MDETELKEVERARRLWVSSPAGAGAIATAVGGESERAEGDEVGAAIASGGDVDEGVGEIDVAFRMSPRLKVEGPATAVGRVGGDNSKTIGEPIGGVSSPENGIWEMGDPTPLNEISSDLLLGFSSLAPLLLPSPAS